MKSSGVTDRDEAPPAYGWRAILLSFLLGAVLVFVGALIAASLTSGTICDSSESAATCIREWFAAVVPAIAIIVAIAALRATKEQGKQVSRQTDHLSFSLLNQKIDGLVEFQRGIVSISEIYITLSSVVSSILANREGHSATEILSEIAINPSSLELLRSISYETPRLKIVPTRHVSRKDIDLLLTRSLPLAAYSRTKFSMSAFAAASMYTHRWRDEELSLVSGDNLKALLREQIQTCSRILTNISLEFADLAENSNKITNRLSN